jgi:hypothetical protein
MDNARKIPEYSFNKRLAEKLVRRIKDYWLKENKIVDVWLESERLQPDDRLIYYVRSDLKYEVPKQFRKVSKDDVLS